MGGSGPTGGGPRRFVRMNWTCESRAALNSADTQAGPEWEWRIRFYRSSGVVHDDDGHPDPDDEREPRVVLQTLPAASDRPARPRGVGIAGRRRHLSQERAPLRLAEAQGVP